MAAANESVSAPIRVVVVEPNAPARLRFKNILRSADDFELAADFANANEGLTTVPRMRPDLLLLGIHRQDADGIKCIKLLKRILISLKIIVVMGAGDTDMLESCVQAGADNCLVKPASAAQCLATLRFAERSRNKIESNRQKPESDFFYGATSKSCWPLSHRENEVMGALAEGLLYKEIADKLGISYSAVHKYQQNIFRKFHVNNRSEAIRVWLRSDAFRGFNINTHNAESQNTAWLVPRT